MSKRKRNLLCLLLTAVFLLIALYLALLMVGAWTLFGEFPSRLTLISPDSEHTVYIRPWHGRDRDGVDLCIPISPGCIKTVNKNMHIRDFSVVVWSEDASVIALSWTERTNDYYILAYDFTTGETIGDQGEFTIEERPPDWMNWAEVSLKIQALLSKRGGAGEPIPFRKSDCLRMGLWEGQKFLKDLKAGRELDRARSR